jgi:hypothetical protein
MAYPIKIPKKPEGKNKAKVLNGFIIKLARIKEIRRERKLILILCR